MIFSSRCASCHNVNKVVVGPALAGVSDRHTEDWIIHFVHSSQSVIKGGDTAAIALYEKAGFRAEGLLRQAAFKEGRYVDVIPMALLATDRPPLA